MRRDLKTAEQILVRDLRTGQDQERELYRATTLSSYIATIALSPDGQELAFVSNDQSTHSNVLAVMPTAGGEPRELLRLKEPEFMYSPEGLAWTPDGREVLFVKHLSYSPQDQRTELWRISAEGGKPRRLELAMEDLRSLRFHPDGRRIAFTTGQSKAEVWVLDNFLPVLKAAK